MGFESRKIAFLLVYTANSEGEGVARSKNYLSYIGAELNNFRGGEVFWGTDEDQLLREAFKKDYDYALLIREGTVFLSWSDFLKQIEKVWTPKQVIMGHILDRKARYYEVHNQCFFVDLNKFANMGFPPYKGDTDRPIALHKVIRSAENFHDDYTPLAIKAGEGVEEYSRCQRGSRWISEAFKCGYEISPFPQAARELKEFFYPEHEESYQTNKVYVQDAADNDRQSFFMYNTEDFAKSSEIGPLHHLIMPASGLMPLYVLRHYGYAADPNLQAGSTRVVIYDIGHLQLEVYRKLIFEWDGRNYRQYLEWILGNNLLKGQGWESFDRSLFEKYFTNEENFAEWLKQLRTHCEFDFIRANALAKNFKSQPWLHCGEREQGYLSLSNVFHYWPTSIELSYRYRLQTLNELMSGLAQKSPQLWVNFCRPEQGAKGEVRPRSHLIQAKDYRPEEPVLMPWELNRVNSTSNGLTYQTL